MFQPGCTSRAGFQNELLSGLTVALALVPEAVAFAFVAGMEPLAGLYTAFMVGLLAAIFGVRPGMISGVTGAMAVVMVAWVAQHGVQYLFAAVVLKRKPATWWKGMYWLVSEPNAHLFKNKILTQRHREHRDVYSDKTVSVFSVPLCQAFSFNKC